MAADMAALMPFPALGGTTGTGTTKRKPCCRNRKAPWMEGTLETTYKETYTEKEVPRVMPAKEQPTFQDPTHKFDGTTTMGSDFKAWQLSAQPPIKPTSNIHQEGHPFQGDSMYKKDFGPKETKYELVKPKHAFEPSAAPFDGTTTQKTDYKPQAVTAARPMAGRANNIPTSTGPFEGQSVYKDTFQRWPNSKRDAVLAARGTNILGGGDFYGDTTARLAYVPKEIGPRHMYKPQDAQPNEPTRYDELPFTEYKQQYVGKEGSVGAARSTKPEPVPMPSAPFDGQTTSQSDYVPYSVAGQRQAPRPQPAIVSEKLPFEGKSTYKKDFEAKATKYELVKPKHAFEPNPAPFDGTTTHNTNFVPFGVPHTRASIGPTSALNKESHPFEGSSTYKSDFLKMPPGLRAERKIASGGQFETGPFDGTTTYRKDFQQKEIAARAPRRMDDDCSSCDSDPNCRD